VLVYGDRREFANPRERLIAVSQQLKLVAAMPPDIDRHSKLVGALIDAGQLLQGVADAGAPTDTLNDYLYRIAACVVRSADSDFRKTGELPATPSFDLPTKVELRVPEGFAFYAVYPEAYAAAARRLSLSGRPRVIGLRSIGTTLAAVVAAALGVPPPITVRPFGDPFARQVELPPDVLKEDAHYVIVDEGPGLSGSSFGAVADWLEVRGVSRDRIAFLPSHGGDLGPRASQAHRERWSKAQRVPADFNPDFLDKMFGPLEEYSVGSPFERRKYIGTRGGERVLVKFAGLGAIGERKLDMARALYARGFTPEPLGVVLGFLIERWCADAQPLGPADKPVEEIARYIGARACLFPADEASGAGIEELLTMCRRNLSLALGEGASQLVDQWDAGALSPRVARVRTDNKLDRHEWLRLSDGRLLKSDALDHHQGHDLIGCQDVAWDVAGAMIEFDLEAAEIDRLIAGTGRPVDRVLLDFYRLAYVAFRLGQAELAGTDASAAERYRRSLHLFPHQRTPGRNRPESSFN
jgi:hypothetical protein